MLFFTRWELTLTATSIGSYQEQKKLLGNLSTTRLYVNTENSIVKYPGVTHGFTGEYDMYINEGMSPYEAWHEVMVRFAGK